MKALSFCYAMLRAPNLVSCTILRILQVINPLLQFVGSVSCLAESLKYRMLCSFNTQMLKERASLNQEMKTNFIDKRIVCVVTCLVCRENKRTDHTVRHPAAGGLLQVLIIVYFCAQHMCTRCCVFFFCCFL